MRLAGPFVPPSMLDRAAPESAAVAHLFDVMLAIGVVVFAIVMGLLFVALAHRRDAGEAPDDPARSRAAERWVAIGGGLTAAILVALVAASVSAQRALSSRPEGDVKSALRVAVTGHQWWWEVQYPDPQPANLIRTANEIHVPVGRPVALELTSTDVIHSFWVPNLAPKRDLIPGRPNTLWFTAQREGIYRGQCAEFCGMGHPNMAFRLVAESPASFDRWVARQRQPAPEPADPHAAQGRDVFLRAPCTMCHAITGIPAYGTNGPDLTHVASRLTLGAGILPNDRGHLGGWIVDPNALKPGVKMPRNLLEAGDLDALLAYLETLR